MPARCSRRALPRTRRGWPRASGARQEIPLQAQDRPAQDVCSASTQAAAAGPKNGAPSWSQPRCVDDPQAPDHRREGSEVAAGHGVCPGCVHVVESGASSGTRSAWRPSVWGRSALQPPVYCAVWRAPLRPGQRDLQPGAQRHTDASARGLRSASRRALARRTSDLLISAAIVASVARPHGGGITVAAATNDPRARERRRSSGQQVPG